MRGLRSTKTGFGVVALLIMLASGCSSGDDGAAPAAAADAEDGSEAAVEQQFDLSVAVTSTKFNDTRRIPRIYSCTQDDISPPITWGDVPEGTVRIALMVDGDQFPGPLWGHWVLRGIPPGRAGSYGSRAQHPRSPRHRPEGSPGHEQRRGDRVVRAVSPAGRPELSAGPRRRADPGSQPLLLPRVRPGHGPVADLRRDEVGSSAGHGRARTGGRRASPASLPARR